MSFKRQSSNFHHYLHSILRIVLGWLMFWAFIDKLFGLGFATKPQNAWIVGGSPTSGFLNNAVKGPFSDFFHSLAGSPLVDWLFMLGLLGVGIAFLLGIALKFAGYAGALMMALMYLAVMSPTNNPIVDDHIVNAVAFLLIAHSNAGEIWGFQKAWQGSSIPKLLPFLK